MKIYGKKELAMHIVVYALMLLAGVISLVRGNFGGLIFFLMAGVSGQETLPNFFDGEKYERHIRREKFAKEVLRKKFGVFSALVRGGPLVLILAALLLHIFYSGLLCLIAVVALVLIAVLLMVLGDSQVKKSMPEDSSEETN